MSQPGLSLNDVVIGALTGTINPRTLSKETLQNMQRELNSFKPNSGQRPTQDVARSRLAASPGLSSERSDSPGLHETSSDNGSSVSMLAGAGRFGDDSGSASGGITMPVAHSPHGSYASSSASPSAGQPLTLNIPGVSGGGGSLYPSHYSPAFISPSHASTKARMVGVVGGGGSLANASAAVTQPSPVRTPYNGSPSKPKVSPFSASPRGEAPPMLFGDFFMKANAIRPVAMMGQQVLPSPPSAGAHGGGGNPGVGMATAGTPTTSGHASVMGGGGRADHLQQQQQQAQSQARRSSAQAATTTTAASTPVASTPTALPAAGALLPDVTMAQLGPTGEFGFSLLPWEDEERRGQQVSKGVPWTFSSKTNTLYVKRMQPCLFTFALQRRVPFHPGLIAMLSVRMEFAETDWREEAATMWPYPERCPLHVDNLKKDRKLSGNRSRHNAISRNEACRYIGCSEYVELRFPFESNVRSLTAGTVLNYTEQLMFTCYNSCSSVKRRPTKLVCSLIQVPDRDIDTPRAHVLGRVEVQVRVCACPGRDRPHIEDPKAKTPAGVKGEGDLDARLPAAKRHRLTSSMDATNRDENGLYIISRKVRSARNFRLVNNFIDLLDVDEDLERDMTDDGVAEASSPEQSSAASNTATDELADVEDASSGVASGAGGAGPLAVAANNIDAMFA